jgi:N-acetylglutamate synthase-like GNAT family acetyltransferase
MDDRASSQVEPTLRRADERDAPAIHDLVVRAYSHYTALIGRTPIPMLADHAAAVREREVWVLVEGGVLAGVLELEPRPGYLWIENVAVSPDRQGHGLGRRLLSHAEVQASRHGLPELRLLTNERYLANLAMYRRYGYVETHRTPHLGTDLVHFAKPVPSATDR